MPKKGNSSKKKSGKAAPQLTAEQLYQQAQIALQYDDCESARDALRRAVKLEPENLEVVEAYGSLLAEMGDEELAVSTLQKAVELSPEAGHEKYMYLGQLLDGEQALAMTRKGIELLQRQLDEAVSTAQEQGSGSRSSAPAAAPEEEDAEMGEEDDDEPEALTVSELQAQLCSALCSLAEMLMGQSETVEAVAAEVEALLGRAQATCSTSPEPGQAIASLRYEQGRPEEALALLQASMKLWFKPHKAQNQDDDMEGDEKEEDLEEEEEDEEGDMQPSYEFRFECAKLLLELEDSTEDAIQVLEDLVEEDDSNPHTWHLLGLAYYGGHMLEEAKEIYEKGMKLLKKLGVAEDDELHADYDDLKRAIEEAAGAAGEV